MDWLLLQSPLGWLAKFSASEFIMLSSVAVFAITAVFWFLGSGTVKNMPPGPTGLPLLGYLPWIDPKAPHLTLSKLVDRYGKVFSLKMGSVSVIVMADPKVVKEAFNQKSTTGRAPLYLTHGIMKGYGLICAEGWLWRDHRKFVAGFMRDQGMRAAVCRADMERRIQNVAQHLTEELSRSEEPVDISIKLLHHVGNTMNELVFGMTYAEEDPTWRWLRHLLEEGTKLVGVAGPMNFLPWLRFLPTYRKVIRFITENQSKTHDVYQKIVDAREVALGGRSRGKEEEEEEEAPHEINTKRREEKENEEDNHQKNKEHEEDKITKNVNPEENASKYFQKQSVNDTANRTSGADHPLGEDNRCDVTKSHCSLLEEKRHSSRKEEEEEEIPAKIDKDFVPLNIIEAYIKERSERGEDVGSFTYEQLHHVAADLFGAGSETTITTLRWHLLNMALFPDVQNRVHKELDEFVGGELDHIALDQAPLLPVTQAAIMETQRLRSIVPLGVPHGASENLTIEGYDVPAGAMLLPLLWFIHRDPDTWKDPEQYIPDRFLDEEGNLIRQHPAFMPFQAGRRMCIGDEFAKMILFVFTTRILLKFRLTLGNEDPTDDPTKDPICGISLCPRPFKLVFTPRIPQHDVHG